MEKFKPYISLIRPNYQINFIEVIIGALFVSHFTQLSLLTIFLKLTGLFFCFCAFYGGIYTLNDVADLKDDKKDKRKKQRVLPSGKIPVFNAFIFAILLMIFGFSLALYLFGGSVAKIFILFLIINLFYTFLFKKIPYIDLFVNCLTHPLRLVLGASIIGFTIPGMFLFGCYFLAAGLGLKIRLIMKENGGEVSRPSLRYYTLSRVRILKNILFLLLFVVAVIDRQTSYGWYLLLAFLYVAYVFDFPIFKPFGKLFRKVYVGK